jgi:hypothetical protein
MASSSGLPSRSGEEWFEIACTRAALAGLAGRAGSGVEEPSLRRPPRIDGRGHQAVAAFNQAL